MILTNTADTNINHFLAQSGKDHYQKADAENSFSQIMQGKFNDFVNVQENGVSINKEAASSPQMEQPDFVKKICYTDEDFFRTFAPMTHYQGKWCSMGELIDLWKPETDFQPGRPAGRRSSALKGAVTQLPPLS